MRLFRIVYNILIKLLLWARLRKPKNIAFLQALVAPCQSLWDKFKAYASASTTEVKRTSQVVHIQAALNDRYDAGLRRIRVVDGVSKDALPLYRKDEDKPLGLYRESENQPKHLFRASEVYQLGADFIIEIPVFIVFDNAELSALVNKYKLPGKMYIVKQV